MTDQTDMQFYGGIVIKGQEVGIISPDNIQMDDEDAHFSSKTTERGSRKYEHSHTFISGGSPSTTVGFNFTSQDVQTDEPNVLVEDGSDDEITSTELYNVSDPTAGTLTEDEEHDKEQENESNNSDEEHDKEQENESNNSDEEHDRTSNQHDPYEDSELNPQISTKEDFDKYIDELNNQSADVFGRGISDSDSDSDEFPEKKGGNSYIPNGSLDKYITWN
jgi:hypothetical protein